MQYRISFTDILYRSLPVLYRVSLVIPEISTVNINMFEGFKPVMHYIFLYVKKFK